MAGCAVAGGSKRNLPFGFVGADDGQKEELYLLLLNRIRSPYHTKPECEAEEQIRERGAKSTKAFA
jgi:hypothetical protein